MRTPVNQALQPTGAALAPSPGPRLLEAAPAAELGVRRIVYI
jgi:hypothetical protein